MALQPLTLVQPWDGKEVGAVIIQTTAGSPLPLNTFTDCEEAEAFLQWCTANNISDYDICGEDTSFRVQERWRQELEAAQ